MQWKYNYFLTTQQQYEQHGQYFASTSIEFQYIVASNLNITDKQIIEKIDTGIVLNETSKFHQYILIHSIHLSC